jgi:glycosyltransferase involved in cell wall biosynthesis
VKIGIFDPYLDTMSGGERYMLSIASCLAKEHDVSIFWDSKTVKDIQNEAKRKFAMDLSEISFIPSLFGRNTSLLTRLKKSKQYDLIIVLSDGSIPFLGCPLVLHFQAPTEWVKLDPLITKLKMMRTKKVVCNSVFTKRFIDKKFNVNSVVLYPPVNVPERKIVQKENIILNVGRFGVRAAGSSFKKQEVLAKAFVRMRNEKRGKGWKFVLVMSATESEQEEAESFASSLTHEDIDVIINPDSKKLSECYAKAKLYWHAAGFGEDLNEHPDRAEHFGLSTVEAMYYGAVPIVIDAGGQPEIVTDGENGFLWGDIDELLVKTHLLMSDEKKREIFAVAAEKRAEYFQFDRFCRELSEIIIT